MGVVYLAERADGHFDQCAAVKVLRAFTATRVATSRRSVCGVRRSECIADRYAREGRTEESMKYARLGQP
jgi:hypothetical protein